MSLKNEVGPLVCEMPSMPADFPGGALVYLFVFKESNNKKRNRSGFSTDPVGSHRNPWGYVFLGDVDRSLDKSESWGLFEEEEKDCQVAQAYSVISLD